MSKKVYLALLFFFIFAFTSIVGIKKYMDSTLQHVYGKIPDEAVLLKFDFVQYTIPVIDEEGNRGTQLFKVKNQIETGQYVKLYVRKNKVRKYELMEEEDLPTSVRNNL